MPEPFEIIARPLTLFVAPVGTAFPAVDAAPPGPWVKVGTEGALNYKEDGVTVQHTQSVETFRGVGESGPRKVFRTEEDLIVSLVLADLTLEEYQHALNSNPVTTVPPGVGVAGFKKLGLSRGLDVAQRALLLRGDMSPEGDGWKMQYEIPKAFQTGEPELVYAKGEPVGIALEWTAVVDPNAISEDERFGRVIVQNADPT